MISWLKNLFGKNNTPKKPIGCCGGGCCAQKKKSPLMPIGSDAVEILRKLDEKIVIGKIHDIQPHPDPKVTKVRITQTEVAPGEMRQILCGAPNIEVGMIVPVAKVGAKLSEEFEIGERKIRGELSQGMICSESELGFPSEDKKGIWELPAMLEQYLGKSLRDF